MKKQKIVSDAGRCTNHQKHTPNNGKPSKRFNADGNPLNTANEPSDCKLNRRESHPRNSHLLKCGFLLHHTVFVNTIEYARVEGEGILQYGGSQKGSVHWPVA